MVCQLSPRGKAWLEDGQREQCTPKGGTRGRDPGCLEAALRWHRAMLRRGSFPLSHLSGQPAPLASCAGRGAARLQSGQEPALLTKNPTATTTVLPLQKHRTPVDQPRLIHIFFGAQFLVW